MGSLGLTSVLVVFQWIGAVEGWTWTVQWSAVKVRKWNLASSGFRTLDPWPEVGSTKISVMQMLWCSYGTGQQEGAINYIDKGRYLYSLEYIPLVVVVFINIQLIKEKSLSQGFPNQINKAFTKMNIFGRQQYVYSSQYLSW